NVSGDWRYGIRLYNKSHPGSPLRNVTIMNVKLKGWNVSESSSYLKGSSAIYFNANRGKISNVEIDYSGKDYYKYWANCPLYVSGDYNTIENLKIENCGGSFPLSGKHNSFRNSILNGTRLQIKWSSYNEINNVTISNIKNGLGLAINIEHGEYPHNGYNKIIGCKIYNSDTGIRIWYSNYNRIENCYVENCKCGIKLEGVDAYTLFTWGSSHSVLSKNVIKNCKYGISLTGTNNTLSGNKMINCTYALQIYGFAGKYKNKDEPYYYYFLNNIDTSNTMDGKPIYYVLNVTDKVYDSSINAGAFYCINCSNIVVKDLTLRKNGVGLYLIGTRNARIENVTTTENDDAGMILNWVSNVDIINCNVSNNSGIGIHIKGVSYEVPPVEGFNNNITVKGCRIVDNSYTSRGTLRGGISISESRDVFIKDTLIGNNTRGDGICLYYYSYTSNVTIQNVTIFNSSYGIIGSGNNKLANVTVKNSRIYDNNFGIYIIGYGHTIIGNQIYNNHYYSHGGYGISLSSDNSTVAGNIVEENDKGILVYGDNNDVRDNVIESNIHGIGLYGKYNYISNNTIANSTKYGVDVYDEYNRIINNTVNNSGEYGFYISSKYYYNWIEGNIVDGNVFCYLFNKSHIVVSNITIDAEKISNLGSVVVVKSNNVTLDNAIVSNSGIYIYETNDSVFRNVKVTDVKGSNGGVYIKKSNNIMLSGTFSNNSYGVNVRDSSVNVTNSTVSSNSYGIYITSSSNNTIANNTVSSNNYDGIYLSSSDNNTIANNTVLNNGYGIYLYRSSNNVIANNTVSSNGDGIYLKYSNSNTIYLNNFINNTHNVYSYYSTNIWNSTKKITYTYNGKQYTNYLGNYWSDY
ncbi:hypothetical protein DRO21_07260, partial [archaeon]